jgi:hypothetical protein
MSALSKRYRVSVFACRRKAATSLKPAECLSFAAEGIAFRNFRANSSGYQGFMLEQPFHFTGASYRPLRSQRAGFLLSGGARDVVTTRSFSQCL